MNEITTLHLKISLVGHTVVAGHSSWIGLGKCKTVFHLVFFEWPGWERTEQRWCLGAHSQSFPDPFLKRTKALLDERKKNKSLSASITSRYSYTNFLNNTFPGMASLLSHIMNFNSPLTMVL